MKIRIVIWMVILVGFWFSAIRSMAQTENEWSVVIYDPGVNALVDLTPASISVTPLPNIDAPEDSEITQLKLTENRRYLVSIVHHTDPYLNEAWIMDFTTQEVIPVPVPPLNDEELFFGYYIGVTNASITQMAMPYIGSDPAIGLGGASSGGIAVVDLATGLIIYTLDMDATFQKPMAWLDDWTDAGIWFAPRCHGCNPITSYTYLVWNPDTDSIVETQIFNDFEHLERLPATGEMIYSEYNSEFVSDGIWFTPPNVVTFYQPGANPPDSPGQVVYYDMDNLHFRPARWIMNGRGFLVPNGERHNVVVLRDGQQFTIDYANNEHFIAMTSDGWLTFDRDLRRVHQYSVSTNGITQRARYQAQGEIKVAHIYLLPTGQPLPPFAIDISPPDIFFCSGSLPPRLAPGDWAEVIFDAQGEITLHALVVGDVPFDEKTYDHMEPLPLGAHVQVLEGPVCATDGSGQVKVQYQNLIGWMTEVWGAGYYLAPVTDVVPLKVK